MSQSRERPQSSGGRLLAGSGEPAGPIRRSVRGNPGRAGKPERELPLPKAHQPLALLGISNAPHGPPSRSAPRLRHSAGRCLDRAGGGWPRHRRRRGAIDVSRTVGRRCAPPPKEETRSDLGGTAPPDDECHREGGSERQRGLLTGAVPGRDRTAIRKVAWRQRYVGGGVRIGVRDQLVDIRNVVSVTVDVVGSVTVDVVGLEGVEGRSECARPLVNRCASIDMPNGV